MSVEDAGAMLRLALQCAVDIDALEPVTMLNAVIEHANHPVIAPLAARYVALQSQRLFGCDRADARAVLRRIVHDTRASSYIATILEDVPDTMCVPVSFNALFDMIDDDWKNDGALTDVRSAMLDMYSRVYVEPCKALDVVTNTQRLLHEVPALVRGVQLSDACPEWCAVLSYCCSCAMDWLLAGPRGRAAARAVLMTLYDVAHDEPEPYAAPDPNHVQAVEPVSPAEIAYIQNMCDDLAGWR